MTIAYLPFYVDYYESISPDFPQEKAALAARCAEILRTYGTVVWDGQLIGDVAAARAAGERLARAKVDCVVVVTTIAVFGGIAWAALEVLEAPLLLWNAQQIETVGGTYSMVDIVRNTGQIGTQALANTLLRQGRRFSVVTGYGEGSQTRRQLDRYFRIQGAASALKNAHLLAIGEPFPLMTDIEIDDDALRQLGATVTRLGEPDLTHAYGAVPQATVNQQTTRLRQEAEVGSINNDELARSVRLSAALQTLVLQHGAHAGTVNCHGGNCLRNPAIGITACYALGVQNGHGRPFTCTGDLPTALAMLLLKKLTGAAMYTEVQVMDELREAVVIANSGEGEDGLRRAGAAATVRGNSNFKGLHGRGASFAYPLQAGPATIVSLSPTPRGPQAFRLVAAEGEILDEPLPDTGALAGFFRFGRTGLHHGYRRWLEAGVVHHAATAPGHVAGDVAEVAALLDAEFIGI